MKIQRAHKIRLMPNNAQARYFSNACGVARFTYNWALAEWKGQYAAGEKPSSNALKKQFNQIKRNQFPWIIEVTKCAAEQPFTNLGKAFQGFFRNVKEGKGAGYPRFKKRGIHDSFYITNDKIMFNGKRVKIPKLGWVRMREALRFDGKVMSATVSKTADMWFISVQVEQTISDSVPIGPVLGVDIGIKTLATISDGRTFENPRALGRAQKQLRRLNKSVSRKKKGSANRKKAVARFARRHYRVSCIRLDSTHKATTAIAKSCSVVGIEDLNVAGMMKNHRLARALSDASMSEFHRQLTYKMQWSGGEVIKADRWFPSSKTCSACGYIMDKLPLSVRQWTCPACRTIHDRDQNASINLKQMAVGSTVSACRLGSTDRRSSSVKLLIGQEFLMGSHSGSSKKGTELCK